MLGHLVSSCRQSPPDFGIASWLRAKAQRLAELLQANAPRKQPHLQ